MPSVFEKGIEMSFLKKKAIFGCNNFNRPSVLSNQLKKSVLAVFFCLIITGPLLLCFSIPAQADPAATTSITITKYANDGTTVVSQTTISYQTMQSTLPVQGDGTTHYFMQGPSFDPNNLWDPSETVNIKDKGAVKGTNVKDLCTLVGGMSSSDDVQIKAADGWSLTFYYANVYTPTARQGPLVVCWYTKASFDSQTGITYYPNGAYVPDFSEGMQLVFLAQTTNTALQHVFGNQDMHDCLPQADWHYYVQNGIQYPSVDGISGKWLSQVNIYVPTFWDLNGDHICNIGDVVKLGLKWGLTGSHGWIPEDLNSDGVINIGDVVKIGLHWGQTW